MRTKGRLINDRASAGARFADALAVPRRNLWFFLVLGTAAEYYEARLEEEMLWPLASTDLNTANRPGAPSQAPTP